MSNRLPASFLQYIDSTGNGRVPTDKHPSAPAGMPCCVQDLNHQETVTFIHDELAERIDRSNLSPGPEIRRKQNTVAYVMKARVHNL